MSGKALRLSRLFPDGRNAVVVAIDHGQTFGPMPGLVNFTAAAEQLHEANGVLLAPQMARFSGDLFRGHGSPTMICRLNWNSIHCEPWHYHEAQIVPAVSVEAAVRAGADVVMAALVLQTGSEARDAANVSLFSRLAEDCDRLGIPLIGEVFSVPELRQRPDEFHDYIMKVCRIITELGADAIKTFYTGEKFAEVTAGTPVPVFALGAEKMANEVDALRLAQRAVAAGARGVVFGRNVLQANDPSAFLRALKDVVQRAANPQELVAR